MRAGVAMKKATAFLSYLGVADLNNHCQLYVLLLAL